MSRKGTKDLTVGSELKVILGFAIPLYLSNILQQLYNLTDVSIIGNYLGDQALTAMGSVSIIYDFFMSFVFGMGSGFSVVISKHFGSGDEKKLRQAVANTTFIALIWISLLTVVGLVIVKPLMRILGTPESVFDMGYSYISILLSLLFFTFCYNVFSGLLRAIGNSVAPLICLFISVTLNIGLDLLFVVNWGWGIRGAAIATIVAQTVSSLFCFIYILKKVPALHFRREDVVISREMIMDLFTSGIAFALMYSIVSMGTMILQRAINSLGEAIIAAHTTARKISSLCMMTLSTLANAMATFAGQNHGAGKYGRIRTGLKKILFLTCGISTVLIVIIQLFGESFVKLVSGSSNPELIYNATMYIRVDILFYYVLAVILITRATLQGLGSKFAPLFASGMELGIKLLTVGVLAKQFKYWGIIACEPLSWLVCAIYILIVFFNNKQIKASHTIS